MWIKGFFQVFILILTVAFIGGCGVSNESSVGTVSTRMITGYVVDDPIVGAKIEVYNQDLQLLFSMENATNEDGGFKVQISSKENFPLIVKISGGTINGKPFNDYMYSICFEETCNVTPITTIVALSFMNDLKNTRKEQADRFAEEILGITDWQSIDAEELKRFREFISDGKSIFTTVARIARDSRDNFIDDLSLKAVFPNAKFREAVTKTFDIDTSVIGDLENRTLKIVNFMTGEEADINESISWEQFDLEIALIEKLNISIGGANETITRLIYLPFSLYKEGVLNVYSTIFNLLFKDLTLAQLNPEQKKEIISELLTNHITEMQELKTLYIKYINEGDIYYQDFNEKLSSLRSYVKGKISNPEVDILVTEISRGNLATTRTIRRSASTESINSIEIGGIEIDYNPDTRNFVVWNKLPAYWAFTDIESYKAFESRRGDNFSSKLFNLDTFTDSFGHNTIDVAPGGAIAYSITEVLGLKGVGTQILAADFDSNMVLANGDTLVEGYKNTYVFYKDLYPLSSLQGFLNALDLLEGIVPMVKLRFGDKIKEVVDKLSKFKKADTYVKVLSDLADVADGLLFVNELIADVYNLDQLKKDVIQYRNLLDNTKKFTTDFANTLAIVVKPLEKDERSFRDMLILILGQKLSNYTLGKLYGELKELYVTSQKLNAFFKAKGTSLRENDTADMIASFLIAYSVGNREDLIKNISYQRFHFTTNSLAIQYYLSIKYFRLRREPTLYRIFRDFILENKLITIRDGKYRIDKAAFAPLKALYYEIKDGKVSLADLQDNLRNKILLFEKPAKVFLSIKRKLLYGNPESVFVELVKMFLYNTGYSIPYEITDVLEKAALKVTNPWLTVAVAANAVAGKIIAFGFFPNAISVNTQVIGKDLKFSMAIPEIFVRKGYILPFDGEIEVPWHFDKEVKDKYKQDAFLRLDSNAPYLIVTKEDETNMPWFIPSYRLVFQTSKDVLEEYLDDVIEDKKFMDVKWSAMNCNSNFLSSKEDINTRIEKYCSKFKDNELTGSYTGEGLEGYVKKTHDGYPYIDIIDVITKENDDEEEYLALRYFHKTPGIFIDYLDAILYDGNEVKKLEHRNILFRIADTNRLNVSIEAKDDHFEIVNNSDVDVAIIIKPKITTKAVAEIFKDYILITVSAHETTNYLYDRLEEIFFKNLEEGIKRELEIFAFDKLVVDYIRFCDEDADILESLQQLKVEHQIDKISKLEPVNVLEDYLEGKNVFAFIKKFDLSYSTINHTPSLLVYVKNNYTPAPAEIEFTIEAEDLDGDTITCYFKEDISTEEWKEVPCNKPFTHLYNEPGDFTPMFKVIDEHGNENIFDDSISVYTPILIYNDNLDIVMVVDLSGSYSDDLQTFKSKAEEILNAFKDIFKDYNVKVGITSFVDYPQYPYGDDGDYPFKLDLDLTDNDTQFITTINELHVYSGSDTPESQLEAVKQTILQTSWDPNALRIILLFTDANFHNKDEEPDYPGAGMKEVKSLLNEYQINVIGMVAGDDPGALEDVSEISLFTTTLSTDSKEVVEEIKNKLSIFTNEDEEIVPLEVKSTAIDSYTTSTRRSNYLGDEN